MGPQLQQAAGALRDAASQLRSQASRQNSVSRSGRRLGTAVRSRRPAAQPTLRQFQEALDHVTGQTLDVAEHLDLLTDIYNARMPLYYVSMIGLTNAGMGLNHGTSAFKYYASAKGGFTTALNRSMKVSKAAVGISVALNATSALHAATQHGVGSSEFAESAVDGTLSSAAAFVPLGGLAYEGGKVVGGVLYRHTPIGNAMLNAHDASDHIRSADAYVENSDRAQARGDHREAIRQAEKAREEARKAVEQASGWTGMFNATKSLIGR